jgi:hypothetical protein
VVDHTVTNLTATQFATLKLLATAGRWMGGVEIARALHREFNTPASAHMACLTLVRHRLVQRRSYPRPVRYLINDTGRAKVTGDD